MNWDPIISHGVAFILGIGSKAIYDWKIGPAITKSQKKQEKKEAAEAARKERIRQEKIDNLNRAWRNDREVLRKAQQPLRQINQIKRFTGNYPEQDCMKWTTEIENEALKIELLEYQVIKKKLLEYAGKKTKLHSNMLLNQIAEIFLREIVLGKYEPLVLVEEIEEILNATSIPPYSEKDL